MIYIGTCLVKDKIYILWEPYRREKHTTLELSKMGLRTALAAYHGEIALHRVVQGSRPVIRYEYILLSYPVSQNVE